MHTATRELTCRARTRHGSPHRAARTWPTCPVRSGSRGHETQTDTQLTSSRSSHQTHITDHSTEHIAQRHFILPGTRWRKRHRYAEGIKLSSFIACVYVHAMCMCMCVCVCICDVHVPCACACVCMWHVCAIHVCLWRVHDVLTHRSATRNIRFCSNGRI